jgi:hypothetical protein
MRYSTTIFICCLAALVGCTRAHYITGHGDAGAFMLQHAVAYGGRPVTTNGLPTLSGGWKYIQDEHGVGLVFPASRYAEVESFFTAAFGPRSGNPGWAVRDVGVAIYLQQSGSNTLVGIHPPNLGYRK